MPRRFIGWGRLAMLGALFGLALAAVLWSWRVHPPEPDLADPSNRGRNVPGDLATVLSWLAIEFAAAAFALQPWTPAPRRRRIALAGLAFGAWGALRVLVGLHAPPVLLPHDLLVLALGVLLCVTAVVYPATRRSEDHAARAT